MAKLIDGNFLAEKINLETHNTIQDGKIQPHLAAVLVGDDPASHLYVSLKEKACHLAGIEFHKYYLDADSSQEKVLDVINFLNNDPDVNAIIVQLPMPKHLDTDKIIAAIDPLKDADGFGPQNLKDFMEFKARIIPPLPNAIYELIKSTELDFIGKHAVILANSELFAQPIINMMKFKGATSEYVNPTDVNLTQKTQNADVIVIAVGKKWFLDKSMIKQNSIIIDVGINKDDGKVYGDVNPDVDEIAGFRSPVPGGVGPMTIAMLLKNTLELFKLQRGWR